MNPAAMRVDPLDLKERVSCRLTRLHPVQLSAEHERELNHLVAGALNATETGGTSPDHPAGGERPVELSRPPRQLGILGARRLVTGAAGGGWRWRPRPGWRHA